MAVRTPMKFDGSGHLIEMSATDIANLKTEMIRQFGLNPSSTIAVVASAGNTSAMTDTRLQAGAMSTATTAFPAETTTAEPTQVNVTYDKINVTWETLSAPTDTSNRAWPVYQVGGHLYAMSLTDMYDTFVADVLTTLTSGSTGTNQAGTCAISTSTVVAGWTLISATPVFTDTRANTAAYTAAGIPETLDQPTTITNYYVHSINPAGAGTIPQPVFITAGDHLQQYTTAQVSAFLADIIRYYARTSPTRISYSVNTTATAARGSGMVDTRLTGGAGNYQTLQVADEYRAQEFPDGTPSTINTYYLHAIIN